MVVKHERLYGMPEHSVTEICTLTETEDNYAELSVHKG